MRLQDKVVVVTGSTRGIGRAVVEACWREGARVVVCSRNEKAVARVLRELQGAGARATGLVADVSRPEDLERLLGHADQTWGRVDVWVNNAGISGGLLPLEEMPPEEIARIVSVNLLGTLFACRLVLPYLVRQGGGLLLNMSGRGGRGNPSPFLTTYAATKAAVMSLTKSLAGEYKGQPVSIHSILPGMVATDFYEDVQASPRLERMVRDVPYALRAFGVSVETVAQRVVEIAAQEPGRLTGKNYSLLGPRRMLRGGALMTYYRLTGKLSGQG
ncbi:MAG: SDR family NAD(P)-dependent oxidoreductase [Chloroflexota bacterium]